MNTPWKLRKNTLIILDSTEREVGCVFIENVRKTPEFLNASRDDQVEMAKGARVRAEETAALIVKSVNRAVASTKKRKSA